MNGGQSRAWQSALLAMQIECSLQGGTKLLQLGDPYLLSVEPSTKLSSFAERRQQNTDLLSFLSSFAPEQGPGDHFDGVRGEELRIARRYLPLCVWTCFCVFCIVCVVV